MKLLTLFSILFTLSFSAYAAQTAGKEKMKRSGIVEKRQNVARQNMQDNFGPEESTKKQKTKKDNFGFKKLNQKNTQNL